MENRVRNSRWLTIQQVALRLHVSRDTVERWISAGGLKAVDVSSRLRKKSSRPLWRVNAESLEAFLEMRANRPPPSLPRNHRVRHAGVIEFIK